MPCKDYALHFSAVLVISDCTEMVCQFGIFIQTQNEVFVHCCFDAFQNRLLFCLKHNVFGGFVDGRRICLQNYICIGCIGYLSCRNGQHAAFNRGICLVIFCQLPFDILRNVNGIAVLIARDQRNLRQIVCYALYCGRRTAIVIQLIYIGLGNYLNCNGLRGFIDCFAVSVCSDWIR